MKTFVFKNKPFFFGVFNLRTRLKKNCRHEAAWINGNYIWLTEVFKWVARAAIKSSLASAKTRDSESLAVGWLILAMINIHLVWMKFPLRLTAR